MSIEVRMSVRERWVRDNPPYLEAETALQVAGLSIQSSIQSSTQSSIQTSIQITFPYPPG
jgi:hypothetical protein